MRTTITTPPTTRGLNVTHRGKGRFVTSQTMRGKLVYTMKNEKQRKTQ